MKGNMGKPEAEAGVGVVDRNWSHPSTPFLSEPVWDFPVSKPVKSVVSPKQPSAWGKTLGF